MIFPIFHLQPANSEYVTFLLMQTFYIPNHKTGHAFFIMRAFTTQGQSYSA